MNRKAQVGKVGQLREVANLKDWIVLKMLVAAREEVGKSSPDHLPHKVCFVPLTNRARTQSHAVAKHGDSICNRKYLWQFVCDVNDRDSLLFRRANDPEKIPDLWLGERGRRLIED